MDRRVKPGGDEGGRLLRIVDAPSQCLGIQVIQMGLSDPGFGGNFD
jgi:hypothetical protein